MPKPIRAFLSVFVALVAILLWIFRETLNLDVSALLYFCLAAGMVGSIWMFPEFKKDG